MGDESGKVAVFTHCRHPLQVRDWRLLRRQSVQLFPAALTRSKSEGSRMLELLRSEVEELEEVKGKILDKEDGTRKRRMVRPDTL